MSGFGFKGGITRTDVIWRNQCRQHYGTEEDQVNSYMVKFTVKIKKFKENNKSIKLTDDV